MSFISHIDMTDSGFIPLRIQIDCVDAEFVKGLHTRFWYSLETSKLRTIEMLKSDLIRKVLFVKNSCNFRFSSVSLSLENFELPTLESTKILRQLDTVT